jgi:hypothetical protein
MADESVLYEEVEPGVYLPIHDFAAPVKPLVGKTLYLVTNQKLYEPIARFKRLRALKRQYQVEVDNIQYLTGKIEEFQQQIRDSQQAMVDLQSQIDLMSDPQLQGPR